MALPLHYPNPSSARLNVRKSATDTSVLAQAYILNESPQQALLARHAQESTAQPIYLLNHVDGGVSQES